MAQPSHLLMIRPVNFKFNSQTADDNKFQKAGDQDKVHEKALAEFDNFVEVLRLNGVDVTVIDDTAEPATPDSIFPNNWVSFHADGSVYLYPMRSANRRLERRNDILEQLGQDFSVSHIQDLSFFENQGMYLEGTGSMVLDRTNKLAYACISERTNVEVLANFCGLSGYKAVTFHAVDENNYPIYHTNVMMCVADKYVVICTESISLAHERQMIVEQITKTNKAILTISYEQMNHFAGNMLELKNNKNESLLVMSSQALQSLSEEQKNQLEQYSKIIAAPLYTIEQNGGGSARCMMAEIYLPTK